MVAHREGGAEALLDIFDELLEAGVPHARAHKLYADLCRQFDEKVQDELEAQNAALRTSVLIAGNGRMAPYYGQVMGP